VPLIYADVPERPEGDIARQWAVQDEETFTLRLELYDRVHFAYRIESLWL